MILVKFESNYADEFDTEGYQIMSQYDLDLFLACARARFIEAAGTKCTKHKYYDISTFDDSDVENYFGTNEQWSWRSYEDFMDCLVFEHITNKGAWVLDTFLGKSYGMFPCIEY